MQACGFDARDAAKLALKIEAGQLEAPISAAQLRGDTNAAAGQNPEISAKALFSSAETLVLSHAVRQTSEAQRKQQQEQQSGRLHLDWQAIDATAAALSDSSRCRISIICLEIIRMTHCE